MLSRQKRWGAAGAAVLVVGLTTLLLRHRPHGPAPREPEGPSAPKDRWRGFEAGTDVPRARTDGGTPTLDPTSREVTPDQVDGAMAAWRKAILEKHAESVLALDRAFALLPGRYGPALLKMAETDADERVRAFSCRVLGKMRNVALVEDFQRLLGDKSPFVRQNAAWALGELAKSPGGKTAAGAAFDDLRQAEDSDPATEVRSAATNALKVLQ